MTPLVSVSAIDHTHLYVADLDKAVDWYGRVLGLQVLPFAPKGEGRYMATPRGQYCATLFVGKPPSDGDHTTAFRVPGRKFISFGDALPHADVRGRDGSALLAQHVADHGRAMSYYFVDPDGNHLELTTYDPDIVRNWVQGLT